MSIERAPTDHSDCLLRRPVVISNFYCFFGGIPLAFVHALHVVHALHAFHHLPLHRHHPLAFSRAVRRVGLTLTPGGYAAEKQIPISI